MNMPWIICHKDKTTSARRWLIGIGLLLYHSEKGTFLKYLIKKKQKVKIRPELTLPAGFS